MAPPVVNPEASPALGPVSGINIDSPPAFGSASTKAKKANNPASKLITPTAGVTPAGPGSSVLVGTGSTKAAHAGSKASGTKVNEVSL